ncbi:MAG: thioredoxin domain-containing protein [Thiohalobacteraceae bacterium]
MSHSHLPVYNASLETFDEVVIGDSHRRPVLVDLWADWCPPCLVIAPVLEKVVGDYGGRVALVKIEVDAGENMKIAGRYRVRGFPTILLIEAGEEVGRFSSARPAHFIREFIEQHSRLLAQSD